MIPLFTSLDEQDEPGEQAIPSPDRAQVHQSLTDLAEREYYEAEDYEAARKAAAAAAQLLPDEPLGHYFLGLALIALERYEEAIPTWQRLAALSPDLPFVHVNLAGALGSAGRVEEAVEAMGRALELAPGKVRYWFVRGQWNDRLGRHEAAIAAMTGCSSWPRKPLMNHRRRQPRNQGPPTSATCPWVTSPTLPPCSG